MGFNRVAAKLSARESIRVNRPHAALVTLVYYLLTSILYAGISYLAFHDIAQYYTSLLISGYPLEEVIPHILQEYQTPLILGLVIQLVWSVYAVLMDYGYTSYALRMARNEQPGFGHLFDGFVRGGRVLWAAILIEVFTFLWSLVVILPLCVLIILVGYVTQSYPAIMLTTFVAMFAGVAANIAISYRYRLTSYFLLDHPGCTARQAVRRSVATMEGRKMTLFLLDLSFVGWALLSALVSMLLSLLLPVMLDDVLCFWIMPYHRATEANFYDCVTGAETSGDTAGPSYDHRIDGPAPF